MLGSILLATSGHVDHGKSSLLASLTGTHPDRLPQEKARGMTLDLGFVNIGDISFIDVPGHEDYIRHTIAGVHDADGIIMVVSAHEGVQEQTLEHLRIVQGLGHTQVFFVVTKSDLASSERVQALQQELLTHRSRFARTEDFVWKNNPLDAPALLSRFKSFFKPRSRPPDGRIFIDRCFSKKGVGTVVTASMGPCLLKQGQVVYGFNPLSSMPERKLMRARIRSLERQGKSVEQLSSSGRVALCLSDSHVSDLPRGSVLLLSANGHFVQSFKASVTWADDRDLPAIQKKFGVILQFKTLQMEAALFRLDDAHIKIVLKSKLPLEPGDRMILRVLSRQIGLGKTIGTCMLVEEIKPRQKKHSAQQEVPGHTPQRVPPPAAADMAVVEQLLQRVQEMGWWFAPTALTDQDTALLHAMVKSGKLFRVDGSWFVAAETVSLLKTWLLQSGSGQKEITLEQARVFFGPEMGRKKIISILEFCDRHHWTFRKGNSRVLFRLP